MITPKIFTSEQIDDVLKAISTDCAAGKWPTLEVGQPRPGPMSQVMMGLVCLIVRHEVLLRLGCITSAEPKRDPAMYEAGI